MLPAVALSGGQLDSVYALRATEINSLYMLIYFPRHPGHGMLKRVRCATVLLQSGQGGQAKAPQIGPAFASESLAMKIVVEWPGASGIAVTAV